MAEEAAFRIHFSRLLFESLPSKLPTATLLFIGKLCFAITSSGAEPRNSPANKAPPRDVFDYLSGLD